MVFQKANPLLISCAILSMVLIKPVLSVAQSVSVWDSVKAPETGVFFSSIYASGKTIILGSYGPGARSINDGESWSKYQLSSSMVFWGFSGDNKNIYAACFNEGIFKSIDSGSTWSILSKTGLGANTFRGVLASDSFLFAGSYYAGVYRLKIGSDVWENVSSGLSTKGVFASFIKIGKRILASTVYDGIYITDDNGNHWSRPHSGFPDSITVKNISLSGSIIYAAAYKKGVMISRDSGSTWTNSFSGFPDSSIVTSVATFGSNVFVGTEHHSVYRSIDNGQSWNKFSNGLSGNSSIMHLVTSESYLYGVTASKEFWKIRLTPPTTFNWERRRVIRTDENSIDPDLEYFSLLGRRRFLKNTLNRNDSKRYRNLIVSW
jgi:photosystem II stability/assembly factor-like uncharacterized protein